MRASTETYTVSATDINPESRQRYIVVFGKNAIDLEEKLNDSRFAPSGYKIVQLAFNSVHGEFLTILEDEWRNEGNRPFEQ